MDAIDASATVIRLYRLNTVRFGARELAQVITASAQQLRPALAALEQHKGLITHAVEINRLENEADRIHQQAVSRLFDEERDPLLVIKWKETLDFLEEATDRCEDAANVLEGVMMIGMAAVRGSLRTERQISRPSTCGSIKSRMSRSGVRSAIAFSASRPDESSSIENPAFCRYRSTSSAMSRSSSTTRILVIARPHPRPPR